MLVALACLALGVSAIVSVSGCGQSAAVNNYVNMANQVLADVNAKEGDLKQYWTQPIFKQDGLAKSLADFRKALATNQDRLDATDFPEPCRALDESLGRVVDQGRALADIDTQFADYLGALAPLGQTAEEIVNGIQKLETSTDVPSSVSSLAERARTLDSQVRTLNPSTQFTEVNQEFQAFADMTAKNLTEAETRLGKTTGYNSNDNSSDQTAPDSTPSRRSKDQVSSVESLTGPIVDDWGRLNGEMSALIDQVLVAVGLKAKAAEVEGSIGQAIQQIKDLEKQFK